MADTVASPAQGKPYFSLAMKKVKGSATAEENVAVATLTDTSILAESVHEYDPLTVTTTTVIEVEATANNGGGDGHGSDSQTATVSKTAVISLDSGVNIDADRAVKVAGLEPGDVALLATMWICFALAFAMAVSVCVVFGCRRGLVKQ